MSDSRHRSTAVLLAAGLGSRLRPLTEALPKPLVEVAGRSMLERALSAVSAAGISRTVVVTGYRRELVAARLAGASAAAVDVLNPEYATTGTAQSLRAAIASGTVPGDDDLVIVEGDMVFDQSLLAALLDRAESACVIAPHAPQLTGSYAWIDGQSRVVAYKHLSKQGPDDDLTTGFKTVNLCKVGAADRALFASLLDEVLAEAGPRAPLEFVFQRWVEHSAPPLVGIVTARERWAEVDDATDLAAANLIFA